MIDELRARFPGLGFAVYAIEPGAPVTLEVHDGTDVFTFAGETADAAIALAFPPAPAEPAAPEPPASAEPNVFD